MSRVIVVPLLLILSITTVCIFMMLQVTFIKDDELLYLTIPDMGSRSTLYVHDLRIGVRVPLRHDLTWGSSAAWSPNGESVVYSTNYSGEHEIFIMNVSSGKTRRITTGTYPTWYGEQIAYLHNGAFYLYDLTTDEITLMYNGGFREQRANFSPDGSQVVFHIYHPGNTAIAVLDLTTYTLRNVIQSVDTNLLMPSWSPDGTQISYARFDSHPADIYITSLDGRERRRLTNFSENELYPDWSNNGEQIVFQAMRPIDDYRPHIFITAADGSTSPQKITTGNEGYIQPEWRPKADSGYTKEHSEKGTDIGRTDN